jgi:hypothetical protein
MSTCLLSTTCRISARWSIVPLAIRSSVTTTFGLICFQISSSRSSAPVESAPLANRSCTLS